MASLAARLIGPVDRWQQRHATPGFVYGVVKKYGNDRGSTLAAMITFYGFLSLFPLLLVVATILGFVFNGGGSVQHSIQNSALREFPVVGPSLQPGHLKGSTFGLVVGVLGLLWGSLGVAQAVQSATDTAWGSPGQQRSLVPRTIRGLGFFALLGGGVLATTALSTLGSIIGRSEVAGAVGLALAVVANVGLFLGIFRLMGPADVGWLDHLPGAVLAGLGWQLLQSIGASLVRNDLKHTSQLYGQFAVVLGLISFLSLASQLVTYATEVNVVRRGHLWPRAILAPAGPTGPAAAETPFPTGRVAAIAAATLGAVVLERRR